MTAYSPQLAVPQVAASQNNKYLTINDLEALSEGAREKLYLSNTTGDLVLTEALFTRYMIFKVMGRAGAFDITLPDTVNVSNPERTFVVWNADTTYAATIEAATTPGAEVVLKPGWAALCYRNGVDVYSIFAMQAGVIGPYDIGVFVPGLPGNAAIILEFKAVRAFSFASNFAGSQYKNGTNSTTNPVVFTILKNGASVGTISVTSSGVATFASTGSTVFAIGDILSVTAPTPQDATLADVGFVFLGTRT
jgi:hypothetical protein